MLVRYIYLNAVRAKLATRRERYRYSGHNSYLRHGTDKVVEVMPILKLIGGKKAYERFVLAGMGEKHNQVYYAVEDQRFLGEEGFGEELSRDAEEISAPTRKTPLETVFKEIARRVKAAPELILSKDRRWDISNKRCRVPPDSEHGLSSFHPDIITLLLTPDGIILLQHQAANVIDNIWVFLCAVMASTRFVISRSR